MTILCNCAATLAPEIITHFLSLKQHAQWSHLDLIYSYCSNHTAAGPLLLIEYDRSLVWVFRNCRTLSAWKAALQIGSGCDCNIQCVRMFPRSVARYQDAAPPQYKLHKEREGEKERRRDWAREAGGSTRWWEVASLIYVLISYQPAPYIILTQPLWVCGGKRTFCTSRVQTFN